MWWIERKWSPQKVLLLEGVALLLECVTMGMGFEVPFAQAPISVTISQLPVACTL